jgi:hypothetical protein
MQNADKSSGGRTRLLKARAAASGPHPIFSTDQSEQLLVQLGNQALIYQTPTGKNVTESCCEPELDLKLELESDCVPPTEGVVTIQEFSTLLYELHQGKYNCSWNVSWTPFPNATTYTVTTSLSEYVVEVTGGNSRIVYGTTPDENGITITITGTNKCGSVEIIGSAY